MLFLAVSSGFMAGVLVAFPSGQQILKGAQFDRQDGAHSPQAFMVNPFTQPRLQTRVAGVVQSVDHDSHRILIDAISPYPRGESTRMALTYGTSTTVIAMSTEFVRLPEVDIHTLRKGTRIVAVVPRREGQLRADYITVQP